MLAETERLAKVISTLRGAAEQLEELKDNDSDAPDRKPDKHLDDKHSDKPRPSAARVIDTYFEGRYQQYGEYEGFGELIVKKAEDTGLKLPLACALVEQESGGRNVFGCDAGGPFCHDPVTRERVKHIVDGGKFRHGMQGIGLTQITWWEFVLKAEKLGGAHLPANQLQVGFALMADYVKSFPFKEALGAYNAGPQSRGLGIQNGYAAEVAAKHEAWAHRLKDAVSPDHDKPDHDKPGLDKPDRPEPSAYQVRVGPFDTKREAQAFADEAEAIAPGTRAVLAELGDVDRGHKPDHDKPHEPDAVRRARKAANFGKEHLLGIAYGDGWKPGTWPAGPPLYSRCDPKEHTLRYIRNHEMICSALINILRAHMFDLPAIGRKQGDAYPGGTAAIGRRWARMKGARPYSPHREVPDFWVLYSPYQGEALKLQGHVGIKLPGNKVLEGRLPQSSANRGVNEVHRLMIDLCGTGWTTIIPPEIWTQA